MLSFSAIILPLLLSACATSTKINGPDGQQGYILGCHGMVQSMAACFEKANEVCPNGYVPMGTANEAYPVGAGQATLNGSTAPNSSAWLQAQQTQVSGVAVYRYLTVQCK